MILAWPPLLEKLKSNRRSLKTRRKRRRKPHVLGRSPTQSQAKFPKKFASAVQNRYRRLAVFLLYGSTAEPGDIQREKS
jgi:hypothetical protein